MNCGSGCGSGCSTGVTCPCSAEGNPQIDSLEKLVNCYWQNHQQLSVEESWYGSLESLEMAVSEASLALADENVDLDHVPDRIPLTVLADAKKNLLEAIPEMQQADDFDALYRVVRQCLHGLDGIREELVFATALRIGMQPGLEPEKIYLNDDVRDGVDALLELEGGTDRVGREQLPRIFQHPDLPTALVQGCLAKCSNQLLWLKKSGQLH